MQADTKTIKKSFAKSIDQYSAHAVVQKLTAEILAAEIAKNETDFKTVLEIGAGAGVLTEQIKEKLCFENFFANDLTEKSEKYIKKILPNSKFFAGDFRRINFRQKFDLIASNAVFQWFDNPEKVLSMCKNLLNPNGILAFTTFDKENFYELKNITGLTLDYKTADEWKVLLEKDFELIYEYEFEHALFFDNPLEILAHLKNTGVNSLSEKPFSVAQVKTLCENYRHAYPDLRLTYKPLVFVARKTAD